MNWLPLGVLALLAASFVAAGKSSKGKMTPEREVIFRSLMNDIKDPSVLRQFATEFDEQGLKAQAIMLRKRADLRALPEETKQKRREVFRKAMASLDPDVVDKVADGYEKEACTGAAEELRTYAKALRTVLKDPSAVEAIAKQYEKRGYENTAKALRAAAAKQQNIVGTKNVVA